MLHTKIVDSKDNKLSISDAEKFVSSVKFGASIFFTGTVRNINNNDAIWITTPQFQTTSEKYSWMNDYMFVGRVMELQMPNDPSRPLLLQSKF